MIFVISLSKCSVTSHTIRKANHVYVVITCYVYYDFGNYLEHFLLTVVSNKPEKIELRRIE